MVLKELNSLTERQKRIDFVKQHKKALLKEKKSMPKNNIYVKMDDSMMVKPEYNDIQRLGLNDDEVFAVGNTVGFFDSYQDVSLKGSWTKTATEKGGLVPIVKDHKYMIDNLYAQNLGAMVLNMPIRALGYDKEGETEVIGFKIKPYAEEDLIKYQTGTIKQHSMGLMYVNIALAVDDEEDIHSYKIWQSNIDSIINREEAEENGFFWAVYEQKAVELSAVVFAANALTPAFTNKFLETPLPTQPEKTTEPKKPEAARKSFNYKLLF